MVCTAPTLTTLFILHCRKKTLNVVLLGTKYRLFTRIAKNMSINCLISIQSITTAKTYSLKVS